MASATALVAVGACAAAWLPRAPQLYFASGTSIVHVPPPPLIRLRRRTCTVVAQEEDWEIAEAEEALARYMAMGLVDEQGKPILGGSLAGSAAPPAMDDVDDDDDTTPEEMVALSAELLAKSRSPPSPASEDERPAFDAFEQLMKDWGGQI